LNGGVIRLEFTAADLAGLRFAHSPMAEVVASVFAWRDPSAWMVASWRAGVSLRRYPALRAVVAGPLGYAPDFLTPVPSVPRPSLADELRAIAATPLDQVAAEVLAGWTGRTPPPAAALFATDPARGLTALVQDVRRYFAAAIAPVWPRLRAAAETEIAARARSAMSAGPRSLVQDLHPKLGWDGSALLLRYPDKHAHWSLGGHRLTLLPTGFAGAEVYSLAESPMGRAVWYAPRGAGAVWSGASPAAGTALAALLGPTRAAVLTLLATPLSTGEVAAKLGLAAATASHHLTTLRDAGLLVTDRVGRRLTYARTPLGEQLTQSS
jgi:biotin operon repressor